MSVRRVDDFSRSLQGLSLAATGPAGTAHGPAVDLKPRAGAATGDASQEAVRASQGETPSPRPSRSKFAVDLGPGIQDPRRKDAIAETLQQNSDENNYTYRENASSAGESSCSAWADGDISIAK